MRIQLNTIICATDFSDYANQTIPYGVTLAKAFEAKLYVCHVIDLPLTGIYKDSLFSPEDYQKRVIENARAELKELTDKQPIECESLMFQGDTVDEISRVVEEKGADMVIVATHGYSGFKRLALGSSTIRLMRRLHCPLLALHAQASHSIFSENQAPPFKRILVGADFSPESALSLKYALGLAQEFQSELHLVHVMPQRHYEDLRLKTSKPQQENFHDDLIKQYTEKLSKMVPEDAYNWFTTKTAFLIGQPSEALNKYATSENIDLIVMGTRGYGLVKSFFVGSTTDRLVRQAPCPILCTSNQE